ncbi:MAG: HNH endonuclease [Rhodoferax sp.]
MAALPVVDPKKLQAAMVEFDNDFRDSPEWAGWEANQAQLYAIVHEGRRYPPKKIISLAMGMPVKAFWGGKPSNSYLKASGFEVIRLEQKSRLSAAPHFEVGRIYDRWPEINIPYGGGRQGGISASRQTPAIFLFTGESGEQYGYKDHFDERGVFWYSGEGQSGDMKLDKGNYAIVDHANEGRALHVFQTLGKAKGQQYLGEFTYASHEFGQGPDKEGNQRSVIIFHLLPVGMLPDDLGDPVDEDDCKEAFDLAQARTRALAAFVPTEQVGTSQAQRTLYKRSRAVRDYVFMRANGHCESCKEPAPFERFDGTPYLEPHHTTRVSDGGLDHPKHVGAICPTCHREIHYGAEGHLRNVALIQHLALIEWNN